MAKNQAKAGAVVKGIFLSPHALQSSATTSHWLNSTGRWKAKSTVSVSLLGTNEAGQRMVEHGSVGSKQDSSPAPQTHSVVPLILKQLVS